MYYRIYIIEINIYIIYITENKMRKESNRYTPKNKLNRRNQ